MDDAAPHPLDLLVKQKDRIAELEAALRECIPFLAVHMDRWRRDAATAELHPDHANLLDRVSLLSGGEPLSSRLKSSTT